MRTLLALFIIVLASCGQRGQNAPETIAVDSPAMAAPDTLEYVEPGFAELLQKKKDSGVDFFALGQEPSWSLNIYRDSLIQFSSFEGLAMNTPGVEPVTRGDTTTYSATTESGNMTITLVKGACTDIMSGQKFTHHVAVEVKRGKDKTSKTFNGCGTQVD
jgi:uncharacterized membrane protein